MTDDFKGYKSKSEMRRVEVMKESENVRKFYPDETASINGEKPREGFYFVHCDDYDSLLAKLEAAEKERNGAEDAAVGSAMLLAIANEKLTKERAINDVLIEALEFYAQPCRDKSFEGWQKEWRYVQPKNDCDYEFYPNHDIALDALTKAKEMRDAID